MVLPVLSVCEIEPLHACALFMVTAFFSKQIQIIEKRNIQQTDLVRMKVMDVENGSQDRQSVSLGDVRCVDRRPAVLRQKLLL